MKRGVIIFVIVAVLLSSFVLAYGLLLKSNSPADPNDPNLYISLGDFLVKNGFKAQALAVYDKGLEIDSANGKLLNNKGIAYLDIDEAKSEGFFLLALKQDPDYEIARKNLALIYNKQAKYKEAVEQFQVLADQFPENADYNYDLAINLGNLYYYESRSLEDLDKALSYFKKVNEISPGFLKTNENIAVLEEIRGLYT
ncbi:hypothetical protein JXB41_01080 [Candidatus Woesearchaeota archaeon]|nr:hypothetical protein [Candidatus Woesearchaeota archaeon]